MRQPITAEDLYAFQFVGDPRLSPDGSRVAFTVSVADRERNDYRSRIWLVPTDGGAPPPDRRDREGHQPALVARWPSPRLRFRPRAADPAAA